MLLLLTFGFMACSDGILNPDIVKSETEMLISDDFTIASTENVASTPVSILRQITPYIIPGANSGGNRICAEVGLAFFNDANYYEFSSERVNYEGGEFDDDFPAGLSVTYNSVTKLLEWSSSFGIGAVIVKGSNDANVYVYDPQQKSDTGLGAPAKGGDTQAGLSNITFCWNPEDVEPCYQEETAWADGVRYNTDHSGNWATYTGYAGVEKTVTLYAGRTIEAGTVTITPEGDMVKITINLENGWMLQVDEEDDAVKVQGYVDAPSGNPAPGQFETYKGNELEFTVPAFNFYGIHLDVRKEVDCPVE